jgi:hypothetical protein
VPVNACKTNGKGDGEDGRWGGGDMISKRSDESGAAMLFPCFARAGWVMGGVRQRGYVFAMADNITQSFLDAAEALGNRPGAGGAHYYGGPDYGWGHL